jgi:hypothetical protein
MIYQIRHLGPHNELELSFLADLEFELIEVLVGANLPDSKHVLG